MRLGWQEIATALVVLSAAVWLVRKAWRAHKTRVACAHCPVPRIPVRPYSRLAKRSGRTHPGVSTRTK
jgi:hypothetical protein